MAFHTRSGALDLDLIGGTLWLELWDPRPLVHDVNTMICPVAYGQSSSASVGAVPEEESTRHHKFEVTGWNGQGFWKVVSSVQDISESSKIMTMESKARKNLWISVHLREGKCAKLSGGWHMNTATLFREIRIYFASVRSPKRFIHARSPTTTQTSTHPFFFFSTLDILQEEVHLRFDHDGTRLLGC